MKYYLDLDHCTETKKSSAFVKYWQRTEVRLQINLLSLHNVFSAWILDVSLNLFSVQNEYPLETFYSFQAKMLNWQNVETAELMLYNITVILADIRYSR